jgi:hypothetical protein
MATTRQEEELVDDVDDINVFAKLLNGDPAAQKLAEELLAPQHDLFVAQVRGWSCPRFLAKKG